DHRGARRTQRHEDMRPEEDDKPEHKNRQPHGPSPAKITIDVCAVCCSAGAVEAMARQEARSSPSHCTAGDNGCLVDSALAIIASGRAHDGQGERENSMNRRFALALFGLLFAWVPAAAQDWPTKTVRIIVPFGPGSTPDMVGRLIADHIQQK